MIETLEHPHLIQTLSSFPLRFFFGTDFARDVPRRGLGRGIWRGCKGEGGRGRVEMGGGIDGLRGTQRGSTVLVVRAMSCIESRVCIHLRALTHTMDQSRDRR